MQAFSVQMLTNFVNNLREWQLCWHTFIEDGHSRLLSAVTRRYPSIYSVVQVPINIIVGLP